MFTRHVALFACLFAALSAHAAHAQDPTQDTGGGPARNFGGAGQIAFLSDNTFEISHSSDDVTSIHFAPAADYFVIQNLSVGGFIGVDYAKVGNVSGTRFSIGPRVGYNLAFTNLIGLWPKLGLAFAHSSSGYTTRSGDVDVSTDRSNNSIALSIFVPVMMHPTTHFFVGLGPFLDTDLSGHNRVTAYGLKLTVGGWLS
jgi:hypothetical protein